jgi:hypothetical protein
MRSRTGIIVINEKDNVATALDELPEAILQWHTQSISKWLWFQRTLSIHIARIERSTGADV